MTLLDNVLHAGGPNDEATDAVVSLGYVITDADGSTAPGTLTVTFDDDAPAASLTVNTGATVVVDESLGENAGEVEGGCGLGSVTMLGATCSRPRDNGPGQ